MMESIMKNKTMKLLPTAIIGLIIFLSFILSGCVTSSSDGDDDTISPSDPQLSGLTISSGTLSPVFSSSTSSYTVTVPFSVTAITVTPTSSNPAIIDVNESVVTSGDSSPSIALVEGSNTISVEVRSASADSGNEMTEYNIIVTRQSSSSFAQQAYIKASNPDVADGFGWSVALDGETLVVGAQFEASSSTGINGAQSDNGGVGGGAIYVFVRNTAGTWSQQAYIKASSVNAGGFGSVVAISGDTIAAGAPYDATQFQADNGVSGAGAVYIFVRDSSNVWSEQAVIKASNEDQDDWFGLSLSLLGDYLAVGAPREDSDSMGVNGPEDDATVESNSGAVYIFSRIGSAWNQEAYIKAFNTQIGDNFGHAVALGGNRLAVGAPREESSSTGVDSDDGSDNSLFEAGAVYVFERNISDSSWSQQTYLKASNTGQGDDFGYSVSLNDEGTTLAVGAPGESSAATGVNGESQSDDSQPSAGAVYVFTYSIAGPTLWSQQAYIKASNPDGDTDFTDEADRFGYSVSVDGDTLAVAAPQEESNATGIDGNQSDNSVRKAGAVYMFSRSGSDWSQTRYVKASNSPPVVEGNPGDEFGMSISLDDDKLAVGAPFESSSASGINGDQNNDNLTSSGAVYFYE